MATTSNFGTSGTLGVNLAQTWSPTADGYRSSGDQPPYAVGQRVSGTENSVWVFVRFGVGGVTGPGYVCVYDQDFGAVMLSTSNDTFGDLVGVFGAGSALEGDYGWVQIAGTCSIQVAASAAANAILAATATAGQLDDGASTGEFVRGAILTTANGIAAGLAPGELNFPSIDTFPA